MVLFTFELESIAFFKKKLDQDHLSIIDLFRDNTRSFFQQWMDTFNEVIYTSISVLWM